MTNYTYLDLKKQTKLNVCIINSKYHRQWTAKSLFQTRPLLKDMTYDILKTQYAVVLIPNHILHLPLEKRFGKILGILLLISFFQIIDFHKELYEWFIRTINWISVFKTKHRNFTLHIFSGWICIWWWRKQLFPTYSKSTAIIIEI